MNSSDCWLFVDIARPIFFCAYRYNPRVKYTCKFINAIFDCSKRYYATKCKQIEERVRRYDDNDKMIDHEPLPPIVDYSPPPPVPNLDQFWIHVKNYYRHDVAKWHLNYINKEDDELMQRQFRRHEFAAFKTFIHYFIKNNVSDSDAIVAFPWYPIDRGIIGRTGLCVFEHCIVNSKVHLLIDDNDPRNAMIAIQRMNQAVGREDSVSSPWFSLSRKTPVPFMNYAMLELTVDSTLKGIQRKLYYYYTIIHIETEMIIEGTLFGQWGDDQFGHFKSKTRSLLQCSFLCSTLQCINKHLDLIKRLRKANQYQCLSFFDYVRIFVNEQMKDADSDIVRCIKEITVEELLPPHSMRYLSDNAMNELLCRTPVKEFKDFFDYDDGFVVDDDEEEEEEEEDEEYDSYSSSCSSD